MRRDDLILAAGWLVVAALGLVAYAIDAPESGWLHATKGLLVSAGVCLGIAARAPRWLVLPCAAMAGVYFIAAAVALT